MGGRRCVTSDCEVSWWVVMTSTRAERLRRATPAAFTMPVLDITICGGGASHAWASAQSCTPETPPVPNDQSLALLPSLVSRRRCPSQNHPFPPALTCQRQCLKTAFCIHVALQILPLPPPRDTPPTRPPSSFGSPKTRNSHLVGSLLHGRQGATEGLHCCGGHVTSG